MRAAGYAQTIITALRYYVRARWLYRMRSEKLPGRRHTHETVRAVGSSTSPVDVGGNHVEVDRVVNCFLFVAIATKKSEPQGIQAFDERQRFNGAAHTGLARKSYNFLSGEIIGHGEDSNASAGLDVNDKKRVLIQVLKLDPQHDDEIVAGLERVGRGPVRSLQSDVLERARLTG